VVELAQYVIEILSHLNRSVVTIEAEDSSCAVYWQNRGQFDHDYPIWKCLFLNIDIARAYRLP